MKKLCFISSILLILISCDRSLNKSILEPLTVDELTSNIENDSTFADFYSGIQGIRGYIMKSDVTQAKYSKITYKRVYSYYKKLSDSTFIGNIRDEQRKLYDLQYHSYESEVDSILTYWKTYKNKYSFDSIVSVKYDKLLKDYYSYSNDVKNVYIGFEITPLKGTIEQLIFRYCIKSKISNDGKMSMFDSHRCLASSPIRSTKTLYWEADYSDEQYLKDISSTQVAREYDFNIEIVDVRMNGKNISEKLDSIPDVVLQALDYTDDGIMTDYYSSKIIKELIDPNYISFDDFCQKAVEEKLKEMDAEVYEMLKESFTKTFG